MRKEKKYHFIYKTTNNLSGRYYYGLHSTDNLEDGYLGSGTYLRRAIRKHGRENFTREIVEFCKTRKELKSKEQNIVNLKELAKKKCMNLRVGGTLVLDTDKISGKNHWTTRKSFSKKTKKKMSESAKNRPPISDESRKKRSKNSTGELNPFYDKSHTGESKKKMSESAKIRETPNENTRRNHISETMKGVTKTKEHTENIRKGKLGSKNPNFGKCWITNGTTNKLIYRVDDIPDGYKLGRKINN